MGSGTDTELHGVDFARRFGALLREQRGKRRLRHLCCDELSINLLRDAEHGRLPLEPSLITELAGRYGLDLDAVVGTRRAVRVDPTGEVQADGRSEAFEPGDGQSLLLAYLRLIRTLRGDDGVLVLRTEDLAVLADHLETSFLNVLAHIGELMGADEFHQQSMAELLVGGARVVGVGTDVSV